MVDEGRALRAILERCEDGAISPAIALMEMLIETEDDERVAVALRAFAVESSRAREIQRLRDANGAGCARVTAMLRSGVDSPPRNVSVEEGIAFSRRLFDWSVRQSEEASVALYSLGSAALLAEATREIVDVLDSWGSLGPDRRLLDIGCGIGRMEEALSSRLALIRGIDVSAQMIDVARVRCAGLGNVVVSVCSGLDLRGFDDAVFDVVLAVDSFPYLAQAGMSLVDGHFAEASRVLADRGELVVLNLSYRDDPASDRRDVESMAAAHGFDVLVNGETPFALWNGAAFRMRKSPRPAFSSTELRESELAPVAIEAARPRR